MCCCARLAKEAINTRDVETVKNAWIKNGSSFTSITNFELYINALNRSSAHGSWWHHWHPSWHMMAFSALPEREYQNEFPRLLMNELRRQNRMLMNAIKKWTKVDRRDFRSPIFNTKTTPDGDEDDKLPIPRAIILQSIKFPETCCYSQINVSTVCIGRFFDGNPLL